MALWIAETWLRKSGFVYTMDFGGTEYQGTADERLFSDSDPDEMTHSEYSSRATRASHDIIWSEFLPGFNEH